MAWLSPLGTLSPTQRQSMTETERMIEELLDAQERVKELEQTFQLMADDQAQDDQSWRDTLARDAMNEFLSWKKGFVQVDAVHIAEAAYAMADAMMAARKA